MTVLGPQVSVAYDKRKLQELHERLKTARKEVTNLKHPHGRAAVFLDRWVQRNFKTEGGKVQGWEPFAAGGRKKKGKPLDTTAQLLQDEGILRASFLPFANRRNAGIGSDLPYAEPHEEGWGHLPQRRMLPKEREVQADIVDIFEAFVQKVVVQPIEGAF